MILWTRIFLTPFKAHFFNSNCPIDVQLKESGDYHITMHEFVLPLCNIETFRIQNKEHVVAERCYFITMALCICSKKILTEKTVLNLHHAFHIHLWPVVQFLSQNSDFFSGYHKSIMMSFKSKAIGISLRYMSFPKINFIILTDSLKNHETLQKSIKMSNYMALLAKSSCVRLRS